MLSEPGSARQPIHTDSNWDGHRNRDPRPHYFTILIPLTDQDLETGGTRVYPGTHRDINLGAKVMGVPLSMSRTHKKLEMLWFLMDCYSIMEQKMLVE